MHEITLPRSGEGGDLVAEELRAHVKLTGDQQFKQQMKGVGDSADKTGDQVEDLGKDTNFLAAEAAKAKTSLFELKKALDATGDTSLLKAIRKGKRELKLFEGLKAELEAEIKQAAAEAAQAAAEAGGYIAGDVVEGMSLAFKLGGPQLVAGLAVLAAAAAPFVGGIIAAAVVGGVGGGGIAGGLALAAQDSRVKAAAEELAGVATTAFSRAAEPFVAPAIEALDLLGRAAQDTANTIKPAFASLAPVLGPLTQGLIGLVDEAMPGLVKGMEAAKPVLRAIANELPDIGAALGDFIAMASEDTDGAIMAFAALSDIIQVTIRTTGALIMNLSKMYEGAVNAGTVISRVAEEIYEWVGLVNPFAGIVSEIFGGTNEWFESLSGALDKSGDASKDFAGGLDDVGDAAVDAAEQLDAMKQAMDRAFGVEMDILQATMAYEKAIDDLTESVKENGKSLDARDEKGRANRGAILDEIQAIKDLRDANIDNGMAVGDANALYEQQIEALRRNAIALGLNKGQVDELVDAFKGIPRDVEIEVRAPSLLAAIERSRELIRLLGSTAAAAAASSGSYVSGRASGGPVMAGQTYVVGENGPEILQMGASGGTVYNAGQTAAMMSGASGGSSTVNLVVSVKPNADGPLMAAIVEYLQFEVQTTGEGDAQLYFAGR